MIDDVDTTLGFVGTGVMGEPMCRNLALKSAATVIATDVRPEPLQRLAEHGVIVAESPAEVAGRSDVIFLSLPGGSELEAVCVQTGGLLECSRAGQTLVDCSTSPVKLTRELAARFAAKNVDYADAPVARTRAAAEAGTLSIMVGASEAVFERIRPLLACCASEVTHCGGVGAGQVVKLMNNMVLFQTVLALAEALSIARRAGVDGETLFATLSKGSADSFALRNHGMKALLPGEFPERAFPTGYALKDLSYALALAADSGVTAPGADCARDVLEQTVQAGFGDRYFPALLNVIDSDNV